MSSNFQLLAYRRMYHISHQQFYGHVQMQSHDSFLCSHASREIRGLMFVHYYITVSKVWGEGSNCDFCENVTPKGFYNDTPFYDFLSKKYKNLHFSRENHKIHPYNFITIPQFFCTSPLLITYYTSYN